MSDLWSDTTDGKYINRKAKELVEYLEDKRLTEDVEWATLTEVQDKLFLDEHTAVGILFWVWAGTGDVQIGRDAEGKVLMRKRWD